MMTHPSEAGGDVMIKLRIYCKVRMLGWGTLARTLEAGGDAVVEGGGVERGGGLDGRQRGALGCRWRLKHARP